MKKNILIVLLLLITSVFQFSKSEEREEKLLSTLIKAAQSIEKFNALNRIPGNYPVVKRKIIRLLRRSASFADSSDQKDYLLSLIPELRKNGKFDCSLFPGDLKGSNVFLFKKKGKKECFPVVLQIEEDMMMDVRNFTDLIETLVRKGLIKRETKFFPEKLFIYATKVIYPVTVKKNVILYFYKQGNVKRYPMIFLLTNNSKKVFNEKKIPALRKIIEKKENKNFNFKSYIIGIAIHKISHFMAPVILNSVKKEGEESGRDKLITPMDALKDYFYTVEEVRAETEMMNIMFLLEEKTLTDKKTAERIVKTAILSKIFDLKNSRNGSSVKDSIFILNELFKSGGLNVNLINKKLKFNMKLIKSNLEKLNELFFDFERSGKYKECTAYFMENSGISDQVKALLKLF